MALVAVAAVAALIAGIFEVSHRALQREKEALDTKRAFYLAEAGLAEAYTGLRFGKTGNVGTSEAPAQLGDGVFWTEARELGGGRVELQSTGMRGRARSLLAMCVERGETSAATLGVFASDTLVVPEGSRITGTDTAAPAAVAPPPAPAPPGGSVGGLLGGVGGAVGGVVAPAPAPAPVIGRLGSNGDVQVQGTLRSPTTVRADIAAGPQRSTQLSTGVTHVGRNRARSAAAELPAVVLPFEPSSPALVRGSGAALVLPAGMHGLDALRVHAGGRVVVQGPATLVVGTLEVAANGALEFDAARGPIEVVVRDAATLASAASVSSSSSDPSRLVVQFAGTTVATLAATARLAVVVYAPRARVDVAASFRVTGAIVAKELGLGRGVELTFDTHLDEVAKELALPQLLTWRIVEMTTASRRAEGSDPYAILGVDRASLRAPAAAHEDVALQLVYLDQGLVQQTYSGMESGFDWTDVREVRDLTRNGTRVVDSDRTASATAPPPPPSSGLLDALLGIVPTTLRAVEELLRQPTPATSSEIIAAIQYQPWISTSVLADFLDVNSPLGSAELNAMVDRGVGIGSSEQRDVFLRSSPLPPDVVARIVAGETMLSTTHRREVLDAQ